MSLENFIEKNPLIALGAVGAVALALWLKASGAQSVGATLGGAAVNLANGAVSGTVAGIGGLFGVPQTDISKGDAAVLAGNWVDASLYLPAPQLVAATVGNTAINPLQSVGAWMGTTIYDLTHSRANGGFW